MIAVLCDRCRAPITDHMCTGCLASDLEKWAPVSDEVALGRVGKALAAAALARRNAQEGHEFLDGKIAGLETAIEVIRRGADPVAQSLKSAIRTIKIGKTTSDVVPKLPHVRPDTSDLSEYAFALLEILVRRKGETTDLQLAVLAGRSITSSEFGKACKELVDKELAWKVRPRVLIPTGTGELVAGPQPPDPSGDALLMVWNAYLEKNEAKILTAIVDAKGVAMPDEIATDSGYSPTSSAFQAAIKKLRELGLIEGSNRRGYTPCPELS
jgi:hypothetical protein